MPKRNERWKNKKFTKTVKNTTKKYIREKSSQHTCGNCGKVLHGMPHGKTKAFVKKLSKTQRRPSVIFAGTLCNKCRNVVVEEAVKVNQGLKEMDDIDFAIKDYVIQAGRKIK
ncbi:MAG: hypothetical protein Q7S21_05085 [archaeon]|nr:hypothetical protein [archaeon]